MRVVLHCAKILFPHVRISNSTVHFTCVGTIHLVFSLCQWHSQKILIGEADFAIVRSIVCFVVTVLSIRVTALLEYLDLTGQFF